MSFESAGPVLVSVVVAVYKKEAYIAETLKSIAAQTHKSLEIIVINDGSPDRCPEICEALSKGDDRVRYISKENSGVIDTRNLGFSLARGDLVIPFDADDVMPSDFIEKLVAYSQHHPSAMVYAPGAVAIGESTGPIKFPSLSVPAFLTRNAIPNSSAFRRAALSVVHGYRANMKGGLEDWDFWLYFAEHGMEIVRVPDAFYYYRVESGSRNDMGADKRFLLKRQIYENHKALYERWRPHGLVVFFYPFSKVLRFFGVSKEYLRLAKFFRLLGRDRVM